MHFAQTLSFTASVIKAVDHSNIWLSADANSVRKYDDATFAGRLSGGIFFLGTPISAFKSLPLGLFNHLINAALSQS